MRERENKTSSTIGRMVLLQECTSLLKGFATVETWETREWPMVEHHIHGQGRVNIRASRGDELGRIQVDYLSGYTQVYTETQLRKENIKGLKLPFSELCALSVEMASEVVPFVQVCKNLMCVSCRT